MRRSVTSSDLILAFSTFVVCDELAEGLNIFTDCHEDGDDCPLEGSATGNESQD